MKKIKYYYFKTFFLALCFFLLSCSEHTAPILKLSKEQSACDGFAMNKDNLPHFWSNSFPIVLYLSESFPSKYYTEVGSAIQIWNKTLDYKVFQLADTIDLTINPTQNNKNVIYWLENWPYKFKRVGSTFIYAKNNNITEADIIINAQDYKIVSESDLNITSYDITSLLVHELGHILGLDHNDESLSSIMKTHLDPTTLYHQVGHVDIENLTCMYQL